MSDETVFSLADLADLDVSDIEEIRFENLPAGLYGFKVISAELDEKENRDGDNRIMAVFKLEVIEVVSVIKKGVNLEELVGKSHTEKMFIVPDEGEKKVREGIGRIRAFVWDIGMDNKGPLGAIVANTTDHVFTGKIQERPNPNDKSQPFAQLRMDKRKPA